MFARDARRSRRPPHCARTSRRARSPDVPVAVPSEGRQRASLCPDPARPGERAEGLSQPRERGRQAVERRPPPEHPPPGAPHPPPPPPHTLAPHTPPTLAD